MYQFDYYYLIFVVPAILLSLIASAMVNSRFKKYNQVLSKKGITGAQAAQLLLRENGITDVQIKHISGSLTDNYNSGNKTLNLSDSTYASTSIAAIGVAAHETGHAIQDHVGYKPLFLRHTLVPVANIGSRFGPTMVILGIILGVGANTSSGTAMMNSLGELLMLIGIILFSVAVAFYIVTLPVEFNASRRALEILKKTGTLSQDEIPGTRKVLAAAAMTYVAAALTALGNLIRLLLIARNSKNRR